GPPFLAPAAVNIWSEFNAVWNSGLNTTAQICIVNQNTNTGGNDFGLDDITFTTLCLATDTMTVFVSSVIYLTDTVSDVSCFGDVDGAVDLVVSGGLAPYTFNWSNGSNTENISGVGAGNYTVIVTDVNGCSDSLTTVVSEPPALNDSVQWTDVTCNGSSDGTIDLMVWGGTPTYSYVWTNGAVTQDQNAASAGNHSVTITDQNGCTLIEIVTLTEPAAISLTGSLIHVTCSGFSDGGAILSVNNSIPPVQFSWSDGSTDQTHFGLSAGPYGVTVTDGLGCTGTYNFTITQPPPLQVSAVVTDATCFGEMNGSIDLSVSGGTPAYLYNWSHGFAGEDILATGAGNYQVTITDGNLCAATVNYIISEPPEINADINVLREISCFQFDDGILTISTSGGSGGFTYLWDTHPPSDQTTIFSLEDGLYSVTVTDGMGCSTASSYQLVEPDSIWIELQPQYYIQMGDSVMLQPQMFVNSSVEIIWNPDMAISCIDCAFPFAFPLQNRLYTISVEAENGCTASATTMVYVDRGKVLYIPNAFSPNNDGLNDLYYVYTFFVRQFEMRIFNRLGEMVFETKDVNQPWDGTINGFKALPGVYIVDVSVEYIDNETAWKTKSLTVVR
ncbi:MAG TPA: T9SS type B sorting domain-containing protein, partial [Flavobacteriales bacterium]|nr:T9SS type B sorting domain-containing protein [Flavobacteriales bacterium]